MTDWRNDAACRDVDPELFFDPKREAQAFQVCDGCTVRTECLEFAESLGNYAGYPLHGVWGGRRFAGKGSRKGGSR